MSSGRTAHIVIGGNRSLGLGLVRELLKRCDKSEIVFATARSPDKAKELQDLKEAQPAQLEILQLDVLDEQSVQAAADAVSETGAAVSILWICAGANADSGPVQHMTPGGLTDNFTVNVTGSHNVMRAFAPLLLNSTASVRKVVSYSSGSGSIGSVKAKITAVTAAFGRDEPFLASYSTSKAALNMLMRYWGEYLEPHGILVIVFTPGLVATDMNYAVSDKIPDSAMPVETSVLKTLTTIEGIHTAEQTDRGIVNFDGTIIPW